MGQIYKPLFCYFYIDYNKFYFIEIRMQPPLEQQTPNTQICNNETTDNKRQLYKQELRKKQHSQASYTSSKKKLSQIHDNLIELQQKFTNFQNTLKQIKINGADAFRISGPKQLTNRPKIDMINQKIPRVERMRTGPNSKMQKIRIDNKIYECKNIPASYFENIEILFEKQHKRNKTAQKKKKSKMQHNLITGLQRNYENHNNQQLYGLHSCDNPRQIKSQQPKTMSSTMHVKKRFNKTMTKVNQKNLDQSIEQQPAQYLLHLSPRESHNKNQNPSQFYSKARTKQLRVCQRMMNNNNKQYKYCNCCSIHESASPSPSPTKRDNQNQVNRARFTRTSQSNHRNQQKQYEDEDVSKFQSELGDSIDKSIQVYSKIYSNQNKSKITGYEMSMSRQDSARTKKIKTNKMTQKTQKTEINEQRKCIIQGITFRKKNDNLVQQQQDNQCQFKRSNFKKSFTLTSRQKMMQAKQINLKAETQRFRDPVSKIINSKTSYFQNNVNKNQNHRKFSLSNNKKYNQNLQQLQSQKQKKNTSTEEGSRNIRYMTANNFYKPENKKQQTKVSARRVQSSKFAKKQKYLHINQMTNQQYTGCENNTQRKQKIRTQYCKRAEKVQTAKNKSRNETKHDVKRISSNQYQSSSQNYPINSLEQSATIHNKPSSQSSKLAQSNIKLQVPQPLYTKKHEKKISDGHSKDKKYLINKSQERDGSQLYKIDQMVRQQISTQVNGRKSQVSNKMEVVSQISIQRNSVIVSEKDQAKKNQFLKIQNNKNSQLNGISIQSNQFERKIAQPKQQQISREENQRILRRNNFSPIQNKACILLQSKQAQTGKSNKDQCTSIKGISVKNSGIKAKPVQISSCQLTDSDQEVKGTNRLILKQKTEKVGQDEYHDQQQQNQCSNQHQQPLLEQNQAEYSINSPDLSFGEQQKYFDDKLTQKNILDGTIKKNHQKIEGNVEDSSSKVESQTNLQIKSEEYLPLVSQGYEQIQSNLLQNLNIMEVCKYTDKKVSILKQKRKQKRSSLIRQQSEQLQQSCQKLSDIQHQSNQQLLQTKSVNSQNYHINILDVTDQQSQTRFSNQLQIEAINTEKQQNKFQNYIEISHQLQNSQNNQIRISYANSQTQSNRNCSVLVLDKENQHDLQNLLQLNEEDEEQNSESLVSKQKYDNQEEVQDQLQREKQLKIEKLKNQLKQNDVNRKTQQKPQRSQSVQNEFKKINEQTKISQNCDKNSKIVQNIAKKQQIHKISIPQKAKIEEKSPNIQKFSGNQQKQQQKQLKYLNIDGQVHNGAAQSRQNVQESQKLYKNESKNQTNFDAQAENNQKRRKVQKCYKNGEREAVKRVQINQSRQIVQSEHTKDGSSKTVKTLQVIEKTENIEKVQKTNKLDDQEIEEQQSMQQQNSLLDDISQIQEPQIAIKEVKSENKQNLLLIPNVQNQQMLISFRKGDTIFNSEADKTQMQAEISSQVQNQKENEQQNDQDEFIDVPQKQTEQNCSRRTSTFLKLQQQQIQSLLQNQCEEIQNKVSLRTLSEKVKQDKKNNQKRPKIVKKQGKFGVKHEPSLVEEQQQVQEKKQSGKLEQKSCNKSETIHLLSQQSGHSLDILGLRDKKNSVESIPSSINLVLKYAESQGYFDIGSARNNEDKSNEKQKASAVNEKGGKIDLKSVNFIGYTNSQVLIGNRDNVVQDTDHFLSDDGESQVRGYQKQSLSDMHLDCSEVNSTIKQYQRSKDRKGNQKEKRKSNFQTNGKSKVKDKQKTENITKDKDKGKEEKSNHKQEKNFKKIQTAEIGIQWVDRLSYFSSETNLKQVQRQSSQKNKKENEKKQIKKLQINCVNSFQNHQVKKVVTLEQTNCEGGLESKQKNVNRQSQQKTNLAEQKQMREQDTVKADAQPVRRQQACSPKKFDRNKLAFCSKTVSIDQKVNPIKLHQLYSLTISAQSSIIQTSQQNIFLQSRQNNETLSTVPFKILQQKQQQPIAEKRISKTHRKYSKQHENSNNTDRPLHNTDGFKIQNRSLSKNKNEIVNNFRFAEDKELMEGYAQIVPYIRIGNCKQEHQGEIMVRGVENVEQNVQAILDRNIRFTSQILQKINYDYTYFLDRHFTPNTHTLWYPTPTYKLYKTDPPSNHQSMFNTIFLYTNQHLHLTQIIDPRTYITTLLHYPYLKLQKNKWNKIKNIKKHQNIYGFAFDNRGDIFRIIGADQVKEEANSILVSANTNTNTNNNNNGHSMMNSHSNSTKVNCDGSVSLGSVRFVKLRKNNGKCINVEWDKFMRCYQYPFLIGMHPQYYMRSAIIQTKPTSKYYIIDLKFPTSSFPSSETPPQKIHCILSLHQDPKTTNSVSSSRSPSFFSTTPVPISIPTKQPSVTVYHEISANKYQNIGTGDASFVSMYLKPTQNSYMLVFIGCQHQVLRVASNVYLELGTGREGQDGDGMICGVGEDFVMCAHL